MSNARAWAIFDWWFDKDGHWMFGVNGKEKAARYWKEYGIEGLPNYIGERGQSES